MIVYISKLRFVYSDTECNETEQSGMSKIHNDVVLKGKKVTKKVRILYFKLLKNWCLRLKITKFYVEMIVQSLIKIY